MGFEAALAGASFAAMPYLFAAILFGALAHSQTLHIINQKAIPLLSLYKRSISSFYQ